jgi:tetratricopeptide (TPR) repeat protein
MADLHFLEGLGSDAASAYIDQALRVRPYSAKVLMAAGKQAALEGDIRRAIDYWKRSFSTDLQEQRQLVELLVAFSMAAEEQRQHAGKSEGSAIEFILREFEPDLALSRLLLHKLAPVAAAEDVDLLRAHFVRVGTAAAAELDEKAAAEIWIEMSYVYHAMGQDEQAVRILRRAIAVRPNDYGAVLALGVRLLDAEEYGEARQHLEWCRTRNPNEASLEEMLARAVKQQIERQTRGTPSAESTFR